MPINVVNSGRYDSGGNITLSSTGANKLLVIVPICRAAAVRDLTGVTVGGVASVIHQQLQNGTSAATRVSSGIAYIKDANYPAAGSHTITNAWANSPNDDVGIFIEFDNVDQDTPFGNSNSATVGNQNSTVSTSVALTGEAGALGLVIGMMANSSYASDTGFINSVDGHTLIQDSLPAGQDDNVRIVSYRDDVIAGDPETYNLDYSLRGGSLEINSIVSAAIAVNEKQIDVTAPTFTGGPSATNATVNGHDIVATLNEGGTIYAVRLPDGATAPSSAQVKAGQDSTGSAALEAKNVSATIGVQASMTFSTGSELTAYDYYVVAEDDEATPNLQATPTLVNATTLEALLTIDSVTPSNPVVGSQVVVALSNAINASGKTLTYKGESVAIDSQDINSITINSWPYPWDRATADVDFNTLYDLVVADGVESDTVQAQTVTAVNEDYHEITGKPFEESSVYFDDPSELENGDKHWGYQNVGFGISIATDGRVSNAANGDEYTYRLFDVSTGLWGSAATETFQVGSDPLPDPDPDPDTTAPSFIGALVASNITTSSFNVAFTLNEDCTAYIVVVANGSPVPTPQQIKVGIDYDGTSVLFSSNKPITANSQNSFSPFGLSAHAGNQLQVYIVAEDASNNIQGANGVGNVAVQLQDVVIETGSIESANNPSVDICEIDGNEFDLFIGRDNELELLLIESGVRLNDVEMASINKIQCIIDGIVLDSSFEAGAIDWSVGGGKVLFNFSSMAGLTEGRHRVSIIVYTVKYDDGVVWASGDDLISNCINI